MIEQDQHEFGAIRQAAADAIVAHRKFFLFEGIVLMVLGGLAFAFPFISTFAVVVFVGWLFMLGGFFRLLGRFRARKTPGYWWSMAAAALAIIVGLTLILMPLQGMLTLTLVLMFLFLMEGISAIFVAFDFRHHSLSWGWMLFTGIIDLVLVFMIWDGFPDIATWALGVLAGINLLFTGLSLIMLTIAERQQPGIS